MNGRELASQFDEITHLDDAALAWCHNAQQLLRAQHDKLQALEKVMQEIANDYPELSHDKARMQNLDHIKWARAVLTRTDQ